MPYRAIVGNREVQFSHHNYDDYGNYLNTEVISMDTGEHLIIGANRTTPWVYTVENIPFNAPIDPPIDTELD